MDATKDLASLVSFFFLFFFSFFTSTTIAQSIFFFFKQLLVKGWVWGGFFGSTESKAGGFLDWQNTYRGFVQVLKNSQLKGRGLNERKECHTLGLNLKGKDVTERIPTGKRYPHKCRTCHPLFPWLPPPPPLFFDWTAHWCFVYLPFLGQACLYH